MVASGDVGLAFGLAVAAGMATALGAACVLFGSLCKPRILAGSLGFAAGVMLYVSFVEIFATKSVGAFIDNGATDAEAVRYATGCFFGGILLVYLLDLIVCGITALAVWARERDMQKRVCVGATDSRMTLAHPPQAITSLKRLLSRKSLAITNPSDAPEPSPDPPSPDPESPPSQEPACLSTHVHDLVHSVQQAVCTPLPDPPASDDTPPLPVPRDPDVLQLLQDDPHSAALMRTGVLTAIAIFCHNFPEGLATFVATLADPSVGASVAFAIALHNAVEGVCVALPIYYATGSRWKGFFWGVVSGLTEPLGALMGWLVLYDPSQLAFGIVFGIVAGMMVCISLKELVPTALRYDKSHSFVMAWVFGGMLVMAASLLLFAL